ncbi:MAG: 50S ribosomal protein L10 [Candidatus Odinarchaeia archaeon]
MSTISNVKKVSQRKIKEVEQLVDLINKYKVISLTRMGEIGGKQLQELREKLRGQAVIRMAKNTLMKIALDKADKKKKGISKLKEYIEGSVGFIFTNLNPFKLNWFLKKNRAPAPAKPGNIAPKDIVIPAGNTGFPPGPMITELSELGLKTKVQSGTIWIAKDTVVAKKGEVLSRRLTVLLSRLGIKPMEVGLDLIAAYEDGIIYGAEDIDIDLESFREQFKEAYTEAFNLAFNAAYPTSETIPHLLTKAYLDAKNLAINAEIYAPEVINDLIAKAEAQASTLLNKIKGIKPEITE